MLRPLADIAQHLVDPEVADLDDVLGPVLRSLSEDLGLQRVALSLVEPDTGDVAIEAAHGLTPAEVRRGRFQLGEGITGEVVRSGQPAAVPHIRADPRFADKTGARSGADRAFVCVPVVGADQVLGALSAYRPAGAPALEGDVQLLQVVAALLLPAIRRHQARRAERPDGPGARPPPNVVGRSKAMQQVYGLVEQVAPSPATVLLRGESGTGKELVATAIHEGSPRRRGPFVKVNCAALPESVIESELFGHERGAFTGAHSQRKGRFEVASGGTLLLDEIGDLSPATQIKLLRVLQQRELQRVGSNATVTVDVRVVAATSRDLEAMIDDGSFRQDLYYRLNVFPIHLPPLRERRSDVLMLADHFVDTFNRAHGRSVRRISTPAIDMLMAYHWPGNVRELENCIERAVLLARDDVIFGHHLPPSLQTAEATGTAGAGGLTARVEAFERDLVIDALKSSRGNVARAARELGVTERIMGLRVAKYGIEPRRFKHPTDS
ncbi:MAG: sigma 54-interacting transcriptional regulator [Myxococcota bacterium]